MGTGSPGDYRIGPANFQIDQAGCFVVRAANAVWFPSELRIFAVGPVPDGSGDAVWRLATALRVTDSADLDVDDGDVVLTVSPALGLDCDGVATLDDLRDVGSGVVVEIDSDTAQVVAIRCG